MNPDRNYFSVYMPLHGIRTKGPTRGSDWNFVIIAERKRISIYCANSIITEFVGKSIQSFIPVHAYDDTCSYYASACSCTCNFNNRKYCGTVSCTHIITDTARHTALSISNTIVLSMWTNHHEK